MDELKQINKPMLDTDGNILEEQSVGEGEEMESMTEEGLCRLEEKYKQERPNKRNHEENESDDSWTEVKRKEKKVRQSADYIQNGDMSMFEVYISCKEVLPKQFNLARILQENKITNVSHIKYINPFKIKLQINDDKEIMKLMECEKLLEKGWKFHKAMETMYCYGVIKDMDQDTKEEEIIKSITCPNTSTLLSAKRLDRRDRREGGSGWCPSETIRLCFGGTALPPFVYVFDVKTMVEPYIHPVTQCSNCWRMGHSRKMCTSKNVVCPKCGDNHENCETRTLKCVNCMGNHMALSRDCPIYLKEKKIREIMSEFNCTYRRALTMYVPPDSPLLPPERTEYSRVAPFSSNAFVNVNERTPTFAEIVKTTAEIHTNNFDVDSSHEYSAHPKTNMQRLKSQKQKKTKKEYDEWSDMLSEKEEHSDDHSRPEFEKSESKKKVSVNELWTRLKEVIFIKHLDFQTKFRDVVKLCIEWLIIVVVENISDMSMMKNILNLING